MDFGRHYRGDIQAPAERHSSCRFRSRRAPWYSVLQNPKRGYTGYSSTIWSTDGTPNGTHAIFTADFATIRAFQGDNLLISTGAGAEVLLVDHMPQFSTALPSQF